MAVVETKKLSAYYTNYIIIIMLQLTLVLILLIEKVCDKDDDVTY